MGYILAIIRAFFVVFFMATFMLYYFISLIFSKHTKERAFKLRKNYLRLILKILNIKIELEGLPPIMPALYISNHRSFSDPLILLAYLDAFVIAKAEVSKYPLINKGAELTGIVYVDRENRDSRQATRDKMVKVVKSGYNILVYPEGTVGRTKNTLPFKIGTFIEAAKNDFPVVPVAIEYQSKKDLWFNPSFLKHYLQQFTKWKTPVKMKFGPILQSKNGEEIHQKSHAWINETIMKMQENWSEIGQEE